MKQIKVAAKKNNIPIIHDDTLNYLLMLIQKNKCQKVLEIGTAIGYSAIAIAKANPNVKVITIERDPDLYQIALKNVKEKKLLERIQVICADAKEVFLTETFDLIFIDAAKSSNQLFFEKFQHNLNDNGIMITDNINFHGLLTADIQNRNLKQLVRKIQKFRRFLENNETFQTEFIDVGDGISVSQRRI